MAKTYQNKAHKGEEPRFEKTPEDIAREVPAEGALRVLSPAEYITDQQRRWYKGICLTQLSRQDENAETVAWWDTRVKAVCNGLKYLKKEVFVHDGLPIGRLTTKHVGKTKMTLFIKEILAQSPHRGWDISPPNPELIKTEKEKQ